MAILAILIAGGCADTLLIQNRSGAEVGVLVSGKDASGEFYHRGYRTTEAKLTVGHLEGSTLSNEVAAFTIDRPPKSLSTPWTTRDDFFVLTFRPRIEIPVTIWIVKGPFSQQRDHAYEACVRTSILWHNERMGIDFSEIQVIDATTNPKAVDHFAFPDGDVGDSVWMPLRDDIGFVPDRLNIYWVDTVNGSTTNGWSNFGTQVAMGSHTGEDLLGHEIGHGFSLEHTNWIPEFNVTGIMASNSTTRQYITEGEIFRAHLNPSSILNSTYNSRPGELTRACSLNDSTPLCPPVQRRLWPDGVFPAN